MREVAHAVAWAMELNQKIGMSAKAKQILQSERVYHLKLRCYIACELKATPFDPRDSGQLNFYLSAIDDLLRHPDDKPTIGLLLCKSKDIHIPIQELAEHLPTSRSLNGAPSPMLQHGLLRNIQISSVGFCPFQFLNWNVYTCTVEYALRGIHKPIGVADYQVRLEKSLPKEFKSSLPTVEEIEAELNGAL